MTYIIGEIGQNHNGSIDLAKAIIDLISRPIKEGLFKLDCKGVNAVKLTKRDLGHELSKSQMDKIYDSPHSFGRTYGDHRSFLELSNEEHFEIYNYAKKKGLEFVETLCATGCLSLLKIFTPDKLKVASRDLTNLPLLTAMAETKIPMIISTGMTGRKELDDAISTITRFHSNLSILHCVSEYPTHPKNVNLRTIDFLKNNYSDFTIGYSDHTVGISVPIAAVAKGAQIIEKHITLDRSMKGTDQSGSLGPQGVYRMVRDIRLLDMSLGIEDIFTATGVDIARNKLERSIASKRDIKKGEVLTLNDIHLLSPGDGFKWTERKKIIGKTIIRNIKVNEIIYENYITK